MKQTSSWKKDKKWADQFEAQIVGIIKSLAHKIVSVSVAKPLDDNLKATDYVVKVSAGNIACRIRQGQYAHKFHDFTLRAHRTSGNTTELEKIRSGFARWYLYAWEHNGSLTDWIFVDLNQLRSVGLLDQPRTVIKNKDGKTSFVAIGLSELRKHNCIVEEHNGEPTN